MRVHLASVWGGGRNAKYSNSSGGGGGEGGDFTAVKLGDVVEMYPAEQKNITRWLIKLGIFCPGPRICGQRSAGR